MKTYIRKYAGTIVVAAVVAAATMTGARPAAAQAKPGTSDLRAAFGSVDLQKVFNAYKVKQTASEDFNKVQDGYTKILQQLDSNGAVFLPDAEIRELATLYDKTNKTDTDKQRISALETKAKAAGEELRALQNVSTPSETQRNSLNTLTTANQKGRDSMQALQEDYRQRLSDLQASSSQKITDDMKAAISKIAQQKNLLVVFDSNVALYTANDVTEDVIKYLNK